MGDSKGRLSPCCKYNAQQEKFESPSQRTHALIDCTHSIRNGYAGGVGRQTLSGNRGDTERRNNEASVMRDGQLGLAIVEREVTRDALR